MPVFNLLTHQWKKLRNNLLLRRLLTVLSLDILVKASAFLLLPIYLRLMTQVEYGVFNYILSIVYAFSAVMNLGLYVAQSKLYHDHDHAGKGRLIYSIHILLLAGLLMIVLPVYLFRWDYLAVEFLFKNAIDYDRYRFWILLMTLTSLFSYMFTNYLYTSENIATIKKYSLMRVIGVNGLSIAALWLLRKDAIEVRLVVNGGMELLLLILFYGPYIRSMVAVFDSHILRRALTMGFPMMLSAIFNIVINFGDKFFLEKNAGYKELSIYYLSFSCASVISILSNSLQNVWLPLFFKEKDLEKNLGRTRKMVLRLVGILLALSVAIWVAVTGCLWLGIIPRNYDPVIRLLPLLLLGQIVVCVAMLYGNYLLWFEKTSLVLWTGLLISAVSIVLNRTLIPVWKTYGAATTLLVSNVCFLLIYYFIIRHYRKKYIRNI